MSAPKRDLNREILEVIPHARRFAYSLCRNQADADDLLQSTIERILSRPVPEEVELKRWMFRVCRNLWIDGLRADKTRQAAAPDLTLMTNELPGTEQVAAGRITSERVERAINNLPDQYREVLAIVAVGGASYKDAAETLSVPIGTIMSRLGRARALLADATGYAA